MTIRLWERLTERCLGEHIVDEIVSGFLVPRDVGSMMESRGFSTSRQLGMTLI